MTNVLLSSARDREARCASEGKDRLVAQAACQNQAEKSPESPESRSRSVAPSMADMMLAGPKPTAPETRARDDYRESRAMDMTDIDPLTV